MKHPSVLCVAAVLSFFLAFPAVAQVSSGSSASSVEASSAAMTDDSSSSSSASSVVLVKTRSSVAPCGLLRGGGKRICLQLIQKLCRAQLARRGGDMGRCIGQQQLLKTSSSTSSVAARAKSHIRRFPKQYEMVK